MGACGTKSVTDSGQSSSGYQKLCFEGINFAAFMFASRYESKTSNHLKLIDFGFSKVLLG